MIKMAFWYLPKVPTAGSKSLIYGTNEFVVVDSIKILYFKKFHQFDITVKKQYYYLKYSSIQRYNTLV